MIRTTEPQISHFPRQTWTQHWCLTCPEWWRVYCWEELRVSGPAQTPPTQSKALWEMTSGASLCSVTSRPYQVRTNQWERSFDRTAAGSRRNDDDKNKRNWLWLAREAWHQQDLFPPCFALLALEPTNHRTIWITCCHRRGWWETMFPFYVLFFFSVFKNKHFLCPAEASDWLFSLLRVFICFLSWIF